MPEFEGEFEIFYVPGSGGKPQKRYRCNRRWSTGAACAFDTYDLQTLLEHVSQPHSENVRRKPMRPAISPVLGPDGKEIMKEARFKEE
jgi:hypothetical protein